MPLFSCLYLYIIPACKVTRHILGTVYSVTLDIFTGYKNFKHTDCHTKLHFHIKQRVCTFEILTYFGTMEFLSFPKNLSIKTFNIEVENPKGYLYSNRMYSVNFAIFMSSNNNMPYVTQQVICHMMSRIHMPYVTQ